MLKLYGFPISNYYNRVKLVLLEKQIPFEEVLAVPGKDSVLDKHSPARKVPILEVDGQFLRESNVIFEFLEETHPARPLLPAEPMARARVRELSLMMDLHLELVARRLYAESFFGGKVSDETKKEVERDLKRGLRTLTELAQFKPYIAGPEFTPADCTAVVHLPLISIATRLIYGKDALEDLAAEIKPYLKMCGERPAVAKVNADRKAATAKSG